MHLQSSCQAGGEGDAAAVKGASGWQQLAQQAVYEALRGHLRQVFRQRAMHLRKPQAPSICLY